MITHNNVGMLASTLLRAGQSTPTHGLDHGLSRARVAARLGIGLYRSHDFHAVRLSIFNCPGEVVCVLTLSMDEESVI